MKKNWVLYFVAAMSAVGAVQAQTFSAEGLSRPQQVAPAMNIKPAGGVVSQKDSAASDTEATNDEIIQAFERTKAAVKDVKAQPAADDPLAQIANVLAAPQDKDDDVVDPADEEDEIFIPEGELYRLDTPTKDGSVRGGQAFVEMDDQGRMKKVTKIFLFYDKFKITSYLPGSAGCDVRFNILSNLDQKINQLDVKLVWPELTTTLSFSNVAPNTQTYYNYSLLGNGCYNMDKAPNIIVNRCRVKGMTAAECANKLLWLSK